MTSQVPWAERSFCFDYSVHMFPVIFSRLEGTIFRLNSMAAQADEKACSVRTSGWSVKEHIGHLTVLEDLWWQRLRDFKDGKAILTAADMSNAKTREGKYNEKLIADLLSSFIQERRKMLDHIYSFDEAFLQLTSVHPRLKQPMRLIDALFFVAEHDDHHLALITELLKKQSA